MRSVSIDLGNRSYDIRIGSGLLGLADEVQPYLKGNQVVIISNEVVAPLYLEQVKQSLNGRQVSELILADGEVTKSLATAEQIFDHLLTVRLDRTATIIALGGGVIGDMAGFSAACYQRGISFLQIPTTLLSQVDSSVGGKTGVNHPLGKNMIGAFHQPIRVLIDIDTLKTLPDREFSAGLAEVIKYGVINDIEFFQWLESHIDQIMARDSDALVYLIEESCKNKARVVEQDEKESGVRALLNLGHTFGHAIETGFGYGVWLHGEAVATGMIMAAHMSALCGRISHEDVNRVTDLIAAANLPVQPFAGLPPQKMLANMQIDKKVMDGQLRLILLDGIGQAIITADYDEMVLLQTLDAFCH